MDDTITSFTVKDSQYVVTNEGGRPYLIRDGKRIGQMWWLSISSGLGKFRAVAKKGFNAAEVKVYAKRVQQGLDKRAAQPKTNRRGWTGHVALREHIKRVLKIKRVGSQ